MLQEASPLADSTPDRPGGGPPAGRGQKRAGGSLLRPRAGR